MPAFKNLPAQLHGTRFSEKDIQLLHDRFPSQMIPNWFSILLREAPLAGQYFELDEAADHSGLGANLQWLTAEQMVSEAFDFEPGASAVPLGFFPIGQCAIGSGDPYFLDMRVATEDPPVVRLLHEAARYEGEMPYHGIELVASSLSDLLLQATLD